MLQKTKNYFTLLTLILLPFSLSADGKSWFDQEWDAQLNRPQNLPLSIEMYALQGSAALFDSRQEQCSIAPFQMHCDFRFSKGAPKLGIKSIEMEPFRLPPLIHSYYDSPNEWCALFYQATPQVKALLLPRLSHLSFTYQAFYCERKSSCPSALGWAVLGTQTPTKEILRLLNYSHAQTSYEGIAETIPCAALSEDVPPELLIDKTFAVNLHLEYGSGNLEGTLISQDNQCFILCGKQKEPLPQFEGEILSLDRTVRVGEFRLQLFGPYGEEAGGSFVLTLPDAHVGSFCCELID